MPILYSSIKAKVAGSSRRWIMVLLAMSLQWLITPSRAAAEPVRLTVAAEVLDHHGAELPAADEPRTRILLPHVEDLRASSSPQGYAWIELSFQLDPLPDTPYQAVLNASAVPVLYINGAKIEASPTDPSPKPDPGFVPVLFEVPPQLLHAGDNRILVRVGLSSRRLALSTVRFGAAREMEPWYRQQFWIGSAGAKAANLAIGGIAHFFFVLWSRRRKESVYGLFALSCALWVGLILPFFLMSSADSVPFILRLVAVFGTWFIGVVLILGRRLLGYRHAGIEKSTVVAAVAVTLVAVILPAAHIKWVLGTALLLGIPGAMGILGTASHALVKQPGGLRLLLWLAFVALFAGIGLDVALAAGLRPWPGARVASYGVLVYALAVGGWLIRQFIHARNTHEWLKIDLEAAAGKSEEALAARYAAAAVLDRRFAAAAERERFLTEVHEGLGAHLRQSRDLAQSGQLTATMAEHLLNAAMNELRISIESSKPGGRDLLVMLGSLRYRLESRLRRAGIALEWDVADDIPADTLSPAIAADISRVAYEAFSNSIRHSAATALCLRLRTDPSSRIELRITDNGRGFDVDAWAEGRGLRNMQRLAARMGAGLSLSSRPGQTCLELNL